MEKKEALSIIGRYARRRARRVRDALRDDWHSSRCWSLGLALLALASLVVTAYYVNHPAPEINPDTPSYLTAAQHILANGQLVDPARTPGFPLLIAVVYLLAGQGNLMAVSVVHGVLFVLMTLEVYLLACMILRRAWIALAVGLLVVTNTYLLSYSKPVIIEGTSIWLVVSLALVVVLFVRSLRLRDLWLVAALTLILFMTRPEWIYVPVPLFFYLMVIAARRGKLRRLLPHSIAAVLLLYGVLGLYVYANAAQFGVAGVTDVQNINLLGKVIQYHMQNEAPPEYAAVAQVVNTYVQHGGGNPYDLASLYPPLADHYWSLAGQYALAIIEHHPVEFLLDSIPLIVSVPYFYYPYSQINPQGAFAFPLLQLQTLSVFLYSLYWLFPILALLWIVLLFWRRTSRLRSVEAMGAIVLLSLYSLTLTSVGAYGEYMRFRAPVDPLLLMIIWGSLLTSLVLPSSILSEHAVVTRLLSRLWRRIWWVWGTVLPGGLLLSAGASAFLYGVSILAHPRAWVGIHWFSGHPARTPLILLPIFLGALLTYYAYRAHRLHPAVSPIGAQQEDQKDQTSQPLSDEIPDQAIEAS